MLRVKEGSHPKFESRDQLRGLLIKIHLMKSYATEQGMQVPQELAEEIADLGELTDPNSSENESGAEEKSSPTKTSSNRPLYGELAWMTPRQVKEALTDAFGVHSQLAALVKPATPESIEASQPRRGKMLFMSPRVSDVLIVITVIAIIIFFLGAAKANPENPSAPNWLQLSYLGAALLGASFSGLYTAFKYISTRTFDPLCTSSYVTRALLGTVAGLILANFGKQFIGGSQMKDVAPAAFGLIGGYSADAVNLILKRVSEVLVAAVNGSGDEEIKAKQAQLQADIKVKNAKTAADLAEVSALSPDSVKEKIQKIIDDLT